MEHEGTGRDAPPTARDDEAGLAVIQLAVRAVFVALGLTVAAVVVLWLSGNVGAIADAINL